MSTAALRANRSIPRFVIAAIAVSPAGPQPTSCACNGTAALRHTDCAHAHMHASCASCGCNRCVADCTLHTVHNVPVSRCQVQMLLLSASQYLLASTNDTTYLQVNRNGSIRLTSSLCLMLAGALARQFGQVRWVVCLYLRSWFRGGF
jgi:hypothetical protein